jgi:hypothetical protein
VWCVVCGVWCVVCGVWCVVCGVWCGYKYGLYSNSKGMKGMGMCMCVGYLWI